MRYSVVTPDGDTHLHPETAQTGRLTFKHLDDGSLQVLGETRGPRGPLEVLATYPPGSRYE